MNQMSVQKELREFLMENFFMDESDDPISDDESFLESGLIDSTGVLEVVSFLEERYGITVEADELDPENLDSISRISRFVMSKLSGGAADAAD
jgi:acyl carrier protein